MSQKRFFFHFHAFFPFPWNSCILEIYSCKVSSCAFGKVCSFPPLCSYFGAEKPSREEKKQKKKTHNNKFPFFVAQKYRIMQIYAKNTSPKREQLSRLILSTENKCKVARFCISKQRNLIFYTNRHFPIPNPSSSAVSKPFWETDFLAVSSLVFLTSHLSPTAPQTLLKSRFTHLGWALGPVGTLLKQPFSGAMVFSHCLAAHGFTFWVLLTSHSAP